LGNFALITKPSFFYNIFMLLLLSGFAGLNISTGVFVLLLICILAVCFFEFINGFHDTANAVATVIYTKSMEPTRAVVLSGILNFVGVVTGGLGVAMGILKLLPLTDLMYAPLGMNIAFLLAVLISAIVWNLGTWYYGIPASSSHTLIGALIGASLVFGDVSQEQMTKAYEVFTFLLITPVFGFVVSWLLLLLMRSTIKNKTLYNSPQEKDTPPLLIRMLTIMGCMGISYTHGSNDGQKGVGLLMVVLVAFLPVHFALSPEFDTTKAEATVKKIELAIKSDSSVLKSEFTKLDEELIKTKALLIALATNENLPIEKQDKKLVLDTRKQLRNVLPKEIKKISTDDSLLKTLGDKKAKELKSAAKELLTYTDFAPTWTIVLISLCLGIGTMIGWKRVVKTIGEKIGKTAFDYSQGFVSQVVSACTIFASTYFKLPVSTTHIVSSSVMGTMFAKGGSGNIQRKTITNIFMAWILTLPVSIGLSAAIFWLLRLILV
jgi:PiT family inorganic phosphate transporter